MAVKDSLYRRSPCVATTVLCEKLVGAAAEAGYDLARCEALARRINNQSRTIGVAMHACTVPAAGSPPSLWRTTSWSSASVSMANRASSAAFTNLNTLVDDMFSELADNTPYGRTLRHWDRTSGSWQEEHPLSNRSTRVIGLSRWSTASAAPRFQSSTVSIGRLATLCEEAGIHLVRNLIGPYCTSLDMTASPSPCSRWMMS